MSDGRLREAERRWRQSGSVDDEAAFLRERVRAGALPPTRLEVAAACGHPAAARALPAPTRGLLGRALDRVREALTGDDPWRRLRRFEPEVKVRAALAIARPTFAAAGATGDLAAAAARALAATEAWLEAPSEPRAAAASEAAADLYDLIHREFEEVGADALQWAVCVAAAADTIEAPASLDLCQLAAGAVRSLARGAGPATKDDAAAVWRLAAEALVAWTLGAAHGRQ
ncbi:MAG: hypothetical protein M9894_14755 [Planctomycetes bacterium]|nr:hypothetical protein [Planctomycetota bacterium]